MAEHVGIFPSVARTATASSLDITNDDKYSVYQNLVLTIDCTAITSSPSVVFTIQGKDPSSGKYYTILASAAIVGTGTTILRVSPHLTTAANTIAKDLLPHTWRVTATHGNADSITYTVGASMI